MQGADSEARLVLRLLGKAILLFALAAWMHGCAASAQDADQWTDRKLAAASVPAVSASGEGADTKLILAVLARGVMNAVGKEWENPESGARGRITAMSRQEADGPGCLAFTTTRQSFDGINLYRGLACENAAGYLRLRDFAML